MKRLCVFLVTFVFVGMSFLQAQNVQVTGTITSAEDGMPIPGASIMIKGTQTGVAADMDGNYSISVSGTTATLIFRAVGMATQEQIVGDRKVINVVLDLDAEQLEEVIVVAYGTSTKQSFTGSAGVVKKESLEKIQTTNFSKALEGVIAGVQVTGGTGQPGSSANIRIRGIGSVNASNAPLYVVDGAAYDGDVNAIPTEDIESITVLKDAAAAALYGARGANGVIMVTTKKGKKGKTMFSVKANVGVTARAIPEYDRVTTDQWVERQWLAFVNNNIYAYGDTYDDAVAYTQPRLVPTVFGGYNPYNVAGNLLVGADGKINPAAKLLYQDDWNDELSQVGKRQDYGLSFSGGQEETTFYGSLSYLKEDGHVKWSGYNRFSGRVGLTSKVTNWFKIDAGVSGNTADQTNFLAEGTYTTNPFYYGRMMGPIYPIYQRDAEGKIVKLADGTPKYDIGDGNKKHEHGGWTGHRRPYAPNSNLMLTLPLDNRSNTRNSISARFSGEATFLKDFSFKVSGSTDITNVYYTVYQNNKYADAEGVQGRSTKEMVRNNSFTFNQVLSYNKEIGDHSLSGLIGHENYALKSNDLYATRTGFKIETTELVAAAIAEGSSSYEDNYTLEGYFGELKYSFASKYYASASLRMDGSSRFAKESRWGTFYSVAGSWRAKQESFLTDVDWLTDLKLRASYGEQGNDAIGTYYGYQSLFSIDDRNNGTLNGAWYSQLPNPDLKWEKNANLNIGLDFSVLNSRIRGSVEYFVRQSENLLFASPIPQSSGISSVLKNVGTMVNNGIELQLSADVVRTNDFTYTIDFNLTHYKNEITKMPKNNKGEYQEIVSGSKKLAVGHSIYDFWLRDYAGVDPATGNAQYYYNEVDAITGKETGKILKTNNVNQASYYYTGSAIPDIYGGINQSFRYKGFDASIFLTYQLGGLVYDGGYAGLMHTGNRGTHWHEDILDAWTTPGQVTDVPRIEYNNSNQVAGSSRFLTDASFLSLRNITVGYTLPKKVLNHVGASSLRVFATGDNLHLFSKRKGMDPQASFGGVSDYTYIPVRIISVGLNLTF